MVKNTPIPVRFSPEEETAIRASAKAEDRPISVQIRFYALQALRAAGWLKGSTDE